MLLLVAVAVGVTWLVMRGDATESVATEPAYGAPLSSSPRAHDTPDADADSSDPASAPTSPIATPTTSAAPSSSAALTESQALAELEMMRADSLDRVALDGRWVAQVASKSVGITDPLQWADNGTHTFYAVDILVESQLAVESASTPSAVFVLRSTDFGKRSFYRDGQPFWVTLVDEGFGGSDDVRLWCARTFATLSAEELANACVTRTLVPPHD